MALSAIPSNTQSPKNLIMLKLEQPDPRLGLDLEVVPTCVWKERQNLEICDVQIKKSIQLMGKILVE